jgi:hypothetical protein
MADSNVVNLTEDTAPALTDIAYGVKDPGGSPLDRKLTHETLRQLYARMPRTGTDVDYNVQASDAGKYIQMAGAAAARTITFGDIDSSSKPVWVQNSQGDYMTYVEADTSDTIGWPDLKVQQAELVGAGAGCLFVPNTAANRWEVFGRSGGGQLRPKGTVFYVDFDQGNYTYVGSANVSSPLDRTNRNVTYCAPDNSSAFLTGATGLSRFGRSCLQLDGTNGYLGAADSPDWDIFSSTSNVVTVCGWVRCDDTGSVEGLFGHHEDGNNSWSVRRKGNGAPRVLIYSGGSTVLDIEGGTLSQNTWHHIAIVLDGTGTVGLYIDAVQVAYGASFTADTFTGSLSLGQLGQNAWYFNGRLDDWAIVYGNIFGATPNATPDDTFTVPTQALDLVW